MGERRRRRRESGVFRASMCVIILASGVLGGLAASRGVLVAQAAAATPGGAIAGGATVAAPDFVALIAKVKPAVVSITNVLKPPAAAMQGPPQAVPRFPFPFPFPSPFGPNQGPPEAVEARASGFIIDPAGVIVTNNHVVRNEKSLTVTLDDGSNLPARIVGTDPLTDLAVLKVDAGHALSFVRFGNSDNAKPGQWVLAMGNPFGLGGTATAGIISAVGRHIGGGPYDQFIQTDAPINRGNSGGPLFDVHGEVIGVNTAIVSPTGGNVGIGFAIPSNTARAVVAELRETGHIARGYLGVEAQAITPAIQQALHLPNDKGALIASVLPATPAERAGLRPGEVITAVNGQPVNSPRDLAALIGAIKPGGQARLDLLDNGKAANVTVALGSLPGDVAASNPAPEARGARLGMALEPITPEVRSQLNLPPGTQGAAVAQAAPDSPAARAGIQAGDVIVGVGQTPVTSVQEALSAIHEAERKGGVMALRVLRHGKAAFVAIDVGKGAGDKG